eukprot:TRINITY_DN31329_c0_g1_i4.p1 TRINITY_DN31329_c0_g1~~TRINITY_DN31329_c0_g1_i4.p1  ORF type:complete len:347 (-),score=23.79 TRINITY_DN31329_c0_g1_i4:599-1609(-)
MLFLRSLKIKPSVLNAGNFHQPVRLVSFVKNVYKEIDYTAPFDQQEKDFIKQRLNSCSEWEMKRYMSKGLAKKIHDLKNERGKLEVVEELLDIEKLDTIKLEKICNSVLKKAVTAGDNEPTEAEEATKYFRRDIRPAITEFTQDSSILGLRVSISQIHYTLIRSKDLVEWGCVPFLPEVKSVQFHHHNLYDSARTAVEQLPEADFCIQEDSQVLLKMDPNARIKFSNMKCQCYLNCVLQDSERVKSNTLHYITSGAINKMFNLKIGSERLSMKVSFPKILDTNYDPEKPFYLNISNEQRAQIHQGNGEQLAGSCLQALAFRYAATMLAEEQQQKDS